MLEIPEAITISGQLDKTLKGRVVSKVIAAGSPHGFAFYFGDPALYPGMLEGKRIDRAYSCAGWVEIAAGDIRLGFNDGVNPRYYEEDAKLPAKHQLLIRFEDGGSLVCTVQMYGGIHVFPEGSMDSPYYLGAKEKPSPLSDEFDEAYFGSIVSAAAKNESVKALLATHQRIPGFGNGCLHDVLFNAGIHPKTKLSSVNDGEIEALYKSLKSTLSEMTRLGGRDTEKDIFSNPGGYRTLLSSKTVAYPCPKCGGGITRKAYLGGNIYYCENCQPEAVTV
ncbi:MAG: endonuclease VIII [Oscillospiraceae bacterium]|jgi:formamidopyrimidine-DNA glycosylase|nr:endonuclease VIII [Oscillospiraceae bacterium]